MNTITRTDAGATLDRIRALLAENKGKTLPNLAEALERVITDNGMDLPKPCHGAAHSNAHIDNCAVCLNFTWGIMGDKVKVR